MVDEVLNKIYNIELVVEEIKLFPQTYKTILKDKCNDGTCQLLLRKKLNRLMQEGEIYKTKIPGTRFGTAIYYFMPKKYYILVEAGRLGSKVYCFYDYRKVSTFYIHLDEYWELHHDVWEQKKDKMIFEGGVLLFI